MCLQHNWQIFFTPLATVVEWSEGIGKSLLALGTEVALTTFTRQATFMQLLMTAQRTLDNPTQD